MVDTAAANLGEKVVSEKEYLSAMIYWLRMMRGRIAA